MDSETFEISKRRAEKVRIKGHINSLYQRLGELTYGGIKNGDDVSEETNAIIAQLDEAFARVEELFDEIREFIDDEYAEEEIEVQGLEFNEDGEILCV